MSNLSGVARGLPPEQRAIQAKCFHPSGVFVEFRKEEIEQSIPDRFEKIVRKYPSLLALKAKDLSLTYDELNKAANRVARAILAERGEDNEPAAILVEHGAPAIIAVLAVLKAAKIYVLLDPLYPDARLKYILEHSQAGIIVTDNKNASSAGRLAKDKARLLNIDKSDSIETQDNPELIISPDSLAYIMYTSGSTGQPKGVSQNHRNVLHCILSYTNKFHISTEDRLTLLHSCSTGSSVFHLFGSLLNGAALFPFDIREQGVAPMAKWLRHEEISVYHSVPAFFRNLVCTLPEAEDFPKLRLINLSAASASRKDVELHRKYLPRHCILAHTIGSTEAMLIRWYLIDEKTKIPGNHVPVGYSVDDREVFLLDDNGEAVGSEQVGEIAVRSRYLAVGYWRNPGLTKSKFVPDPNGEGRRIYLTGDLGRMAPDGCLFHLGRKDFQVKIRGYRVEVSEIEMALLEHPAVKEVAVVGREVHTGDKRLVAYFVPTGQPAASVRELRNFLKERLPDYMIPSAFVMLRALPLTPNGKVDRLALPAPEGTRPELGTPFAAPRTPVEEELAGIWSEVLGLDQVGIHDDFFELGGHSLLATQVISRVMQRFQVEVPLPSLFEAPTVADMAVVIKQNQAKKAGKEEMARMVAELEVLPDEEARRFLTEEADTERRRENG